MCMHEWVAFFYNFTILQSIGPFGLFCAGFNCRGISNIPNKHRGPQSLSHLFEKARYEVYYLSIMG